MDHFAVFGFPPRPWIDPEILKDRFLRLSAELHPDKALPAEKAEAEARFANLNQSYSTLRNTRDRLLHLLQIHGISNPAHVQSVPPAALEFFSEVAAETKKADDLLKQKQATQSPMLKVQFFQKSLEVTDSIQNLQARLTRKIREIEADIQRLDAVPTEGSKGNWIGELQAAAAALGFLEHWSAQLQRLLGALAF